MTGVSRWKSEGTWADGSGIHRGRQGTGRAEKKPRAVLENPSGGIKCGFLTAILHFNFINHFLWMEKGRLGHCPPLKQESRTRLKFQMLGSYPIPGSHRFNWH